MFQLGGSPSIPVGSQDSFGVDIQPAGTVFSSPITIEFGWDDSDNDGRVDGSNVSEQNLLITKDNVAITDRCFKEVGCDEVLNTFTFQVTSLSEFVIGVIFAPLPALSREGLGLLVAMMLLVSGAAAWRRRELES